MPINRIATALLVLVALSVATSRAEDFTVPEACVVDLVDDLELHATEAGILDRVSVREGARVRVEDRLVQIDTAQAEVARDVARLELRAAIERAEDTIEKEYAEAAHAVALANMDEMLRVVEQVPGAIPEPEMRQGKLEAERARLQIEKAIKDTRLAQAEARVKQAELRAALMAIERRTLRAPFNGRVIEQFVDEKEWVNPGDPIMRLIRLDQLQVEGLVPIAQHAPADLNGCEVTITVATGGGRTAQATGRVVYINPVLKRGQQAVVRAEVTNREERGEWVILPKMTATMTIHLGTGGAAAARQGRGSGGEGRGGLDGQH